MSQSRTYFFLSPGEEGEERAFQVSRHDESTFCIETPEGESFFVDAYSPANDEIHFLRGNSSVDALVRRKESGATEVLLAGSRHEFTLLNERERRMRAASGGRGEADHPELVSPMAGKVVQIGAALGDRVEVGQPIVVIEAMKMENDLKAHRSGVVTEIAVSAGDAVEIGDVLVVIADQEA